MWAGGEICISSKGEVKIVKMDINGGTIFIELGKPSAKEVVAFIVGRSEEVIVGKMAMSHDELSSVLEESRSRLEEKAREKNVSLKPVGDLNAAKCQELISGPLGKVLLQEIIKKNILEVRPNITVVFDEGFTFIVDTKAA